MKTQSEKLEEICNELVNLNGYLINATGSRNRIAYMVGEMLGENTEEKLKSKKKWFGKNK